MPGSVEKFKRSSIWSLVGSTTSLITTLLYTYFILKDLSINSYGEYTYALVLFGFYQVVFLPGLQLILRRFAPTLRDFNAAEHTHSSRHVLILTVTLILASLFLTFCGLLIFMALKPGLIHANFLDINTSAFLLKLLVYSPFLFSVILFKECSESLYNHRENIYIQTAADTFKVVYLLSVDNIEVNDILDSLIYSWILSFCLYALYYFNTIRNYTLREAYSLEWRRYFMFARFVYFNEAGSKIISSSSDYIIVNYFLGASATGIYSFANKVVSIAGNLMPNRLIRSNLRTLYYDRNKSGNVDRSARDFNLILSFNLFFGSLFFVVIHVLSGTILDSFLEGKYASAELILKVLSWSFVLKTITHPLGLFLMNMEDVKIIFRSKILAVINIAILLLYREVLNLYFIAIISMVIYGLKDLVIYIYALRTYSLKISNSWSYLFILNIGLYLTISLFLEIGILFLVFEGLFFVISGLRLYRYLIDSLQHDTK